ncbi:MAG TPA: 23S rRNA pseudouridine(955/2504/2580) synthase RluC [Gammaproteobacteria bacterium]|nr:23S rRNA pseudouridine(955/2504/2580) synthase RluC [Gammaproteobacteria bacterium]
MPARADHPGVKDAIRQGVREVRVLEDREGQRIDNFLLATLKGLPRSRVYQMLRRGEVRVNGGRVKQSYRLKQGDRLRLPPASTARVASPRLPPAALSERIESSIVYEDEGVIVINKPAGIAVHGGSGRRHGVIEALRASRPAAGQLELIHRLDRDTSGALLVAKKRSALRRLHADLRNGRVEKRYLALVRGRWRGGDRTVRTPLEKNVVRSGERMVRARAAGKPSETRFAPLDRSADATLCEALPLTGRTHQIRVHAAGIGHPLAGDVKYGDREFNKRMRKAGLSRMFLHAHLLGFTSPINGRRIRVAAPLDENLIQTLEILGLSAPRPSAGAAGGSGRE